MNMLDLRFDIALFLFQLEFYVELKNYTSEERCGALAVALENEKIPARPLQPPWN